MGRKWIALMGLPLLLTVLVGCPKKKPTTPPKDIEVVSTPVPETPVEEAPEPTPPPAEEMTEEALPSDLVELNSYLAQHQLISDVYFAYDQSDLAAEARDRLAQNASFMREHPEYLFTIEGHCDERGTNDYNLALGQRRASAAKEYLSSLGIEDGRMRTISYGEERPFCTESSESCWSQNRRAHFVVTGRR